jgi:SAM-dependent methyltransferase
VRLDLLPLLNKFVSKVSMERASSIANPILPWLLDKNGSILDFGSGLGHVGCIILHATGREIVPLDIHRYPFSCPDLDTKIFDGVTIPFQDQSFDTSMTIMVLHHLPDPRESLKEIIRVTENYLVVCEDLLHSQNEIRVERIKDTVTNFGIGHITGQYHTESEWEELFLDLGLFIKDKVYFSTKFMFHFDHVGWLLSINS